MQWHNGLLLCSWRNQTHGINNASMQMSIRQLQTVSYSCPSLDKTPVSFDLWWLEMKHKTTSPYFKLLFSCRDYGMKEQCKKKGWSNLVLPGSHLIATIHEFRSKYSFSMAARETNGFHMGQHFLWLIVSQLWSCRNSTCQGRDIMHAEKELNNNTSNCCCCVSCIWKQCDASRWWQW